VLIMLSIILTDRRKAKMARRRVQPHQAPAEAPSYPPIPNRPRPLSITRTFDMQMAHTRKQL
jgi:hypothetical protein